MDINGYHFPDDLLYDREHNWARIKDSIATIGMSDFGQSLAGEIVYAEAPRVGREITLGEAFMSLESGKWVGRVKAIVSGKIIEVNEELEWESTVVNEDPYGEGWFVKVEMSGKPEGLMTPTGAEFAEFIAAERNKYNK